MNYIVVRKRLSLKPRLERHNLPQSAGKLVTTPPSIDESQKTNPFSALRIRHARPESAYRLFPCRRSGEAIVEFNPAVEEITGYMRPEVVGRTHLEILHGSSDPKACPFFEHAFKEHGQSIGIEGKLTKKNGRMLRVAITCVWKEDEKPPLHVRS